VRLLDSPQDVRFFQQPTCNNGDDEDDISEGRPRDCARSFWSSSHGPRVLEYSKATCCPPGVLGLVRRVEKSFGATTSF
jgi:hypothetical protein